jgi:hypothetical protein
VSRKTKAATDSMSRRILDSFIEEATFEQDLER